MRTRCESASDKQIEYWQKWLNEKAPNIPIVKTKTCCEGIFKYDSKPANLDKNTGLFAFSAIGRPESFYEQLKQLEYNIVSKKEYRDHHRFSDNELEKLIKEAQGKTLALVCTEKDAIKIKPEFAEKMDLNILRIKTIPEQNRFSNFLHLQTN